MTDMNFIQSLKTTLKDKNTSILDDEEGSAEFSKLIDTGCYALNALLSGTIFGGFPDNKVVCYAGASSVGKTFFILAKVKHFLLANPTGLAIIYDTESATTKKMFKDRGIDPARVLIVEPETIQQFRTHVLKVVEAYEKVKEKDRQPILMVLDSLGALSTEKELEDSTEGKTTKDMTRAGLIRGTFRSIRLKLAKTQIPLLIANHTYAIIGAYVPTQEMSGGAGAKYSCDILIYLSKKKDRDDKTKVVKGNFITAKLEKSRFTKENSSVTLMLSYETGLDKYYGLLPIALKCGIFTKQPKGYLFQGQEKLVYEPEIISNPEKFYTPENLKLIDEMAGKIFNYGSTIELDEETEEAE